jgi:hypothetical protein
LGFALVFVLNLFAPGVFYLAGAWVGARGREDRIDAYVQRLSTQFGTRARPAARPTPTQHVPITTSYPQPLPPVAQPPVEAERIPTTGETTRL